jgi:DNA polymerase III subunit delta'
MIIGHRNQLNFLSRTIKEKSFSHAYLFCGQEKLGKKKVALETFFSFFNFDLSHPDFIMIEPQGKDIQISQIKEMSHRLSFKCSQRVPFKLAIINDAHLMNQEAQTCLLKTLEEPKGEAVIILISHQEQYLFPAIISRVQKIKFGPVKKKEIKERLLEEKFDLETIDRIVELSLGRPGMALEMIKEKESFNNIEEIEKIIKSSFFSRFKFVKRLSENPEKVKEMLEFLTFYFRSKMIKALVEKKPTFVLRKSINLVEKTNFLISTTNVNSKLALESLMFEI